MSPEPTVASLEAALERARAETRVAEARVAELEAAVVARAARYAALSHDLRSPLTTIIGHSEMLEEDATAAGRHEVATDLRRISAAGLRLLEMIDALLESERA